MSHKILINTDIHPEAIRFLEKKKFQPIVVPQLDPMASSEAVGECAGMVANAVVPIDDAFFQKGTNLKVVGRQGVGYDNVDVEAATRHGVRVVNTPLPIIEPVAEHTLMLMLAVARRLVPGHLALPGGEWRGPQTAPGPELSGKCLGLIGLGNTGLRVAEIATQGFGMQVSYVDRVERPEAEKALGLRRCALPELLTESDFVSVHVNLYPETHHLLDAKAFALMKRGSIFINVSRGPVVDEEALVAALRSGHLGGAGLDVFEVEPPIQDNPLWSLPNVVVTPHVAGWSLESKLGTSMVVEDLVRVLKGEEPKHPVN
jgi:phosphoglycerate dehydrogenase-like enzyme